MLSQVNSIEVNSKIRVACQILSIDEKGIAECTDGSMKINAVFPNNNPEVNKGDYLLVHGKIIGNNTIAIENYKKISVSEFSAFKKLIEDLNNKYKEIMQLL